MKFMLALFTLVIALLLGACAPHTPPPSPQPPSPVVPDIPVPQAPPEEGSLFQSTRHVSLVSDFRARRIGDVVTIVVEEDLKGAKDVRTQTQRKSDMNIGLSGIFGLEFNKQVQPRYGNAKVDAKNAIGGSSSSKFQGSGKTSRNASLSGTISARVVQVLPGGNLIVRGSRELRINNETQYLILTGVVRPQDIGPDNTVSSTRIGDARIEYTGGGVLSEKQNPAWFARILGLIALF